MIQPYLLSFFRFIFSVFVIRFLKTCFLIMAQDWAEILSEIRHFKATVSDRPGSRLDNLQLMRFAERIGVKLFVFGADPTILELAGSTGLSDADASSARDMADHQKSLNFSHLDGLWENLI